MTTDPAPSAGPAPTLVVGGAIVVALLYSFRFASLSLLVDDAFISFRYAERAALHGQLTFNPGEYVEGYSNPSWTLLLALGVKLGVAPTTLAPLAGYACGLVTLALVVWATRRLLRCSLEVSYGVAGLVALQPAWCFWAGAGLEAPLFAALLTAVWAAGCHEARGAGLVAGALAALLAVTRPEGALFAWVVVPVLALRGAPRREVGAALALVALTVAGHLAARHAYYGAWLPNPVLAKAAFTQAGLWRGLSYGASYLTHEGVIVLLPVLAALPWRERKLWALFGLVTLYAAFVVAVGGDGLYRHRLLAHVTPLLFIGIAPGLDRLGSGPVALRALAALGLAGNLALPLAQRGFFREATLEDVRDWEQRWELVGGALRREVQPGTTLGTNVVGRVPYYSGLPTLDLLGLTDPVVATTPILDAGRGYAGHERAAPAYVLERAPAVLYLSVLDGLPFAAFRRLDVVRGVLARGALHRYAALIDDPRFVDGYRPARLPLANGEAANVFVRRRDAVLASEPWSPPAAPP